jgi:hypothetical protein
VVERGQIFVLQDGRVSEPFAIPDVPISIAEGLTRWHSELHALAPIARRILTSAQ